MEKMIAKMSKLLKYISGVIIIAITIVTFAQVIERFVLHSAIRWAEEFACYGLVVGTYFAAASAVYDRQHTRIDFLIRALPLKIQSYVEAFTNIVCAVYLSIFAVYAVPVVKQNMTMKSSVMRVPTCILSGALFISAVFMVLFFIMNAYLYASGRILFPQPVDEDVKTEEVTK